MRLSKSVSAAMIVGALGFGALGPAGAVASADPVVPAPLKPGHGNDDWCPPWCGNGDGNGNGHGPEWNNGNWDKGPWWASNRHEWWDDRNGAPPWAGARRLRTSGPAARGTARPAQDRWPRRAIRIRTPPARTGRCCGRRR